MNSFASLLDSLRAALEALLGQPRPVPQPVPARR